MTVFAFAYDDVFSIVKRPYATREPMSSEDEQIWQKNEEKNHRTHINIHTHVTHTHTERERERVSRGSFRRRGEAVAKTRKRPRGDFSRKSALVRDMLRVRSKEKR